MGLRQTLDRLFSGRSKAAEQVLADIASNSIELRTASLRLKETFSEMLDRNDRLIIRSHNVPEKPRD